MAKITEDQRNQYQESVQFYKRKLEEIALEQKKLKLETKIENKFQNEIKNIKLSLNLIMIYCGMNDLSVDLLNVKNTAFLDKARQLIYDILINLGNILTNYLDVPFSDYAEQLKQVDFMNDNEKLQFIRHIGLCNELIQKSFGDNTKWKWSFVDIDSRFAIIAKNLFDLKKYQKLDQPGEPGFRERRAHLLIIQKLLLQASNGLREKYELSTKSIEDIKKAIDFQKALLRINSIIGDSEKVDTGKKQIEVWNTLMEKHLSEIESKKRTK